MRTFTLACAAVLLTACASGIITEPGGGGDDDSGGNGVDPEVPGAPDGGPLTGTADAAPVGGAPDAEPVGTTLAAGISVSKVSVYQTVEIAVAIDGSAVGSRNAPVVAGADAMFGIFVDVEPGFTARPITATVTIDGVAQSETRTIESSSGDDPTTSGFALRIDGERIAEGAQFAVELFEGEPDASHPGSTDGARYPATGTAALDAESSKGPLKLVIVPFQYNADGSGRLPPTDDAALQAYRDGFLAMFPVADVEITVHAPISYNAPIGSSPQWSQWLETLADLRGSESPGDNVYYYGVAAPASSFGAYCNGGCILGLGYVPGPTSSFLFASVGVSFSGSLGLGTALHEVGHTMGRSHSPCGGVSGADPNYPYSGARIGVWGYDAVKDTLKDPDVATDIMGYCRDQWISDYTYEAIFERIARVNAFTFAPLVGEARRYRVASVDPSGTIHWRGSMELRVPPAGGERSVAFVGAGGATLGEVTGHFYPYDHLPGGRLVVPEPDDDVAPARVRVDGIAGEITW